ncbi:MAG: SCO family protein [Acidobacteriia bacterium]|nr:SCO family protein [Terriglobia bacterium]
MSGRFVRLFLLAIMIFSMPLLIQPQGTAENSSSQENDLQYICPMHPEVKSKTPGTCPKCGMTLKRESHTHTSLSADNKRWGANYFPNVPLITQDGKTVRFYDDLLKGKLVAIDLIYTHCKDACPLETARLVQVQKMLGDRVGKDIFFYSISIDPKQDTPEVLKAYAEKFHVGPGWTFLTGKEEDIELISKKLGLYSEPDPSNRDGHTPSLMIGNEPGGQWMKNSALDNPRFLSLMIGQLMDGWKNRKVETAKNYAEVPTLAISGGQYLFATRCSACHSIGHGASVGPDLLGVTTVRSRAWLSRFLTVPDQMLTERDPIATALYKQYNQVQMPNLHLNEGEVNAILGYLATQTVSSHASTSIGGKAGDARMEPGVMMR